MDIRSTINTVVEGKDLDTVAMTAVMETILKGEATPAQIGGFLVGLRMKGETVEEITAAARVMRAFATPVVVKPQQLIDTCGTGGDGISTFNISTTSAFVVAAAGAKVAKHGNRSVSSRSGSADVLEAAGVQLDLTADQVALCIENVGIGFMFAPQHHGAMKHAIGPRSEIGIRTLFNLLGPLTNPAQALHQVVGVFSPIWLQSMAEVLRNLGSSHVMVVHADDNMDELSICAPTQVAELYDGGIERYTVVPEDFGLKTADPETLIINNRDESLTKMRAVLNNQPGPTLDVVLLNSGAAIYVAGLTPDIKSGVEKAREVIANGQALTKLENLISYSKQFVNA